MPDICEITGLGVDISGAVLPNATFRIERQSGQTVPSGDTFSVGDTFLAVTDSNGVLGRIENGAFVAGIDLVQGFNYVVTPRGADDFRDLRSFNVAVPEGTTSGTINELMILSPLPPIDQATQAVLDAREARDEARLWATEQEDTPVSTDPDEFSAFHWAQKAQESADLVDLGALDQAVQDSEDNAELAMRWATEDEDVPVTTSPNMFSAFHWAMKAEEFAQSLVVPEFATEPQALAGTADDVIMSPLRTAQVLDDDLVDYASQAEAEAGTDNEKLMTPLRTAQAIVEQAGSGAETGAVQFFAMNTAPDGWLKANGAAVSRTSYADLFAAIGTTFGAGDGSTTFNLPDLRGEFLRGWDDGRGVDDSRAFGSVQLDQMQRITGAFKGGREAGDSEGSVDGVGAFQKVATQPNNVDGAANSVFYEFDSANSPDARTSDTTDGETRPRNIALLACIKY